VQYGRVGTSAGQIKGSVTVPYTFQGAGCPLPRVAAARKAVFVSTKEDDLWPKQPVRRGDLAHTGYEWANPGHAANDRRCSEFAEEQRAAAELGDGAADPSEVVEVAAADVDVPLAMPHYNPFQPNRKGNERRRTKRKDEARRTAHDDWHGAGGGERLG